MEYQGNFLFHVLCIDQTWPITFFFAICVFRTLTCCIDHFFVASDAPLFVSLKKSPNLMTGQPRNKDLLGTYEPSVSLNKVFLNPYFWGGYVKGGRLTSHKKRPFWTVPGSQEETSHPRDPADSGKHPDPTWGCWKLSSHRCSWLLPHDYPIGSMGLVYLPIWMVNFEIVGKHTIHGWYEMVWDGMGNYCIVTFGNYVICNHFITLPAPIFRWNAESRVENVRFFFLNGKIVVSCMIP